MHRPKEQRSTVNLVEQVAEVPFYIPATGPATRPRRNLKHDDCFAIFDSHGDIGASPGGPDGVYCRDTRFLGQLELQLNGTQLLLLGSNVRDDNALLTVDLTNPDIYFENKLSLPKDTLHIIRTVFLWNNTAYQRLRIHNHGDRPVQSHARRRACPDSLCRWSNAAMAAGANGRLWHGTSTQLEKVISR